MNFHQYLKQRQAEMEQRRYVDAAAILKEITHSPAPRVEIMRRLKMGDIRFKGAMKLIKDKVWTVGRNLEIRGKVAEL